MFRKKETIVYEWKANLQTFHETFNDWQPLFQECKCTFWGENPRESKYIWPGDRKKDRKTVI